MLYDIQDEPVPGANGTSSFSQTQYDNASPQNVVSQTMEWRRYWVDTDTGYDAAYEGKLRYSMSETATAMWKSANPSASYPSDSDFEDYADTEYAYYDSEAEGDLPGKIKSKSTKCEGCGSGSTNFTWETSDFDGSVSARDDVVTMNASDVSLALDAATTVLTNDSEFSNDTLSVDDSLSTPANGTASLSLDGSTITYTPNSGYAGVDTFTYRAVADTSGLMSNAATVSVWTLPTTDLVANWKFDEITTGTTPDASGNGHTGTIVGGTSLLDDGMNGKSLNFPGSDDSVTVADATSLKITGDMTISLWFNMDVAPLSGYQDRLIGKGSSDTTNNYSLWLKNTGGTTNLLFNQHDGSGSAVVSVQGSTAIQADTWYHAVVTISGNTVKLYLNGVEETNSGTRTGTPPVTSTAVLEIGAKGTTQEFDGYIDDVRMYSSCISSASIETLYNAFTAESVDKYTTIKDANRWVRKNTESTRTGTDGESGEGTVTTYYLNTDGHLIHKRVEEYAAGSLSTDPAVSTQHWHYEYNAQGNMTREYTPSVWDGTTFNDAAVPGVLDYGAKTDGGLIRISEYDATGYVLMAEKVQKGTGGPEETLVEYQYYNQPVPLGIDADISRTDLLYKEIRYAGPNETLPEVTEYFYKTGFVTDLSASDFWDGAAATRPIWEQKKVWLDDTGSKYTLSKSYHDTNNNETESWEGFTDVNTTGVKTTYTYESNYTEGWVMTSSKVDSASGGLNLTTNYKYAASTAGVNAGRLIRTQEPDGKYRHYFKIVHSAPITIAGTTYYDVVEDRVYPHIDESNGDKVTGPVEVTLSVEGGQTLSRRTYAIDTQALAGTTGSGYLTTPVTLGLNDTDTDKSKLRSRTDYIYSDTGQLIKTREYLSFNDPSDNSTYVDTEHYYYDDGRKKYDKNPRGAITYYTQGWVEYDTGKYYRENRVYCYSIVDSTYVLGGPVSVTWQRWNGQTVRQWTGTCSLSAEPTGAETLTELSRVAYIYDDDAGQSGYRGRLIKMRRYYDLAGSNYSEEEITSYDNQDRVLTQDDALDNTTTTMYDKAGRVRSVKSPDDVIMYYSHLQYEYDTDKFYQEDRIYRIYEDSGSYKLAGPIQITWTDEAGRMVRAFAAGTTDGTVSYNATTGELTDTATTSLMEVSRTAYSYDAAGRQTEVKTYYTLPATIAAEGTQGTNYYLKQLAYDDNGLLLRTTDEKGNCFATVYDAGDRAIQRWQGTQFGSAPTASNPNNTGGNLVIVSEIFYDSDYDHDAADDDHLGYVTRTTTLKVNLAALTGAPTEYTYTNYSAPYATATVESQPNQWVQWAMPEFGPWSLQVMDSAGRAVAAYAVKNGDDDYYLSKSVTAYDAAGRVDTTEVYEVTGGTPGAYLQTSYAYDDAGRQRKVTQPGGAFTLMEYDAAGRVTKQDLCATIEKNNTTYDIIVEQTEYQYDAVGRPIFVAKAERNHDADEEDESALTTSDARISYMGSWYDAAGRPTYQANYGTNEISGIPTAMTERPTGDPTPGDTCLVTAYGYNDAGHVETVTDNMGMVTKYYYDALGRKTYMVENYIAGLCADPSAPSARDSDQCRVTGYWYTADNQIFTQKAIDPNADGNTDDNQVTAYTYGGDDGVVSPMYQKSLLVKVKYPDGNGENDNVQFTYYADGSPKTQTDQRGTEHTYEYSTTRKLKKDSITTQGDAAVDITIRRIERQYDPVTDRLTTIESCNAATGGSLRNKVAYTYNGLGQVTNESQGQYDVQNCYVTRSVQYAYADSTKGYRLQSITYPNGRVVYYDYNYDADNTNPNNVDDGDATSDVLNRVTAIREGGETGEVIASYQFVGPSRVAEKDYPRPDVKLSYYDETGGTYAGFDQFGRIVRQHWFNHAGTTATEDDKDLFRIDHGYDLASNRTYADRQVYKGYSQFYTYDHLNRLTNFKAGILNVAKDDVPYWSFRTQGWTLDGVGNQTAVNDYGDEPWSQATFNKANEYKDEAGSRKVSGGDTFGGQRHYAWIGDNGPYETPDANDSIVIEGTRFKFAGLNRAANEDEAKSVVLIGEDIGVIDNGSGLLIPSHATYQSGHYVGYVFGYKSPVDYWMFVQQLVSATQSRGYLYHVTEDPQNPDVGIKGAPVAQTEAVNSTTGLIIPYMMTKQKSIVFAAFSAGSPPSYTTGSHTFPDGLPTGKVGLVTNMPPNGSDVCSSECLEIIPDKAVCSDMLGRWHNAAGLAEQGIQNHNGGFRLGFSDDGQTPVFLRSFRGKKFQTTLCAYKPFSEDKALSLVFDARDYNNYDLVKIPLCSTATAPSGYSYANGEEIASVTSDDDDPVPAVAANEDLWIRVQYDGTNLTVKCSRTSSEPNWSGVPVCYTSSKFDVEGGMIGLSGTSSVYVKEIKVEGYVGSAWVTQAVDNFTVVDANGNLPITPTHDAAGNLTFDGQYAYTYDAWNRLMKVTRAYPNPADLTQPLEGSVIATMLYDGLGRRIEKKITNSGDWDGTHEYYYNGQQTIEQRYGSIARQQYVWGTQYVDELCQIMISPFAVCKPNQPFWVLQDANFNVLGVVSRGYTEGEVHNPSRLVERYEYTPYGQRTVFSKGWLAADFNDDGVVDGDDETIYTNNLGQPGNIDKGDFTGDGTVSSTDGNYFALCPEASVRYDDDPLTMYPRLESFVEPTVAGIGSGNLPLCDVGHQGLPWDREFQMWDNRTRPLNSTLGRYPVRDMYNQTRPGGGYQDGMSLYQYLGSNPVSHVDPSGLWIVERKGGARAKAEAEKNDTLNSLSQQVRLNASEIKNWAEGTVYIQAAFYIRIKKFNYSENKNILDMKVCPGEKLTIPNTVFIGYGEVNGLLARPLVFQQISRLRSGLENNGFNIWYVRGDQVDSTTVQNKLSGSNDFYGYALFGHGEKEPPFAGDLLWSGSSLWGATDVLTPTTLNNRKYKYGAGINYHCYAEKNSGEWRSLISSLGRHWHTYGWTVAYAGPLAFDAPGRPSMYDDTSWFDIADYYSYPTHNK